MVAQAGVRLSAPWLEDGVAWWLEGRAAEAGRVVLVRRDPDGTTHDVVPAGFNVRTSVHEYGGGAYCIHRGTAFVSSFDDQRVYRVDAGSKPMPITPDIEDRRHRYADGRVTADGSLWIDEQAFEAPALTAHLEAVHKSDTRRRAVIRADGSSPIEARG